MPNDDPTLFGRGSGARHAATPLAREAVSVVNSRQTRTEQGARQFVIDHLVRTVLSPSHFCPESMLDELRGYRLSADAVIDVYVPVVARVLGRMWEDNEVDFASVTISTIRLQSLLSVAAADGPDTFALDRQVMHMLVVVPLGEQHSLGAFVLAAQLRRLGARVEVSFCEDPVDLVARILGTPPDMALFSAASMATLETISQVVLKVAKVLTEPPLFGLGGHLPVPDDVAKEISGVDLVTAKADEALAFAAGSDRDVREDNRQ